MQISATTSILSASVDRTAGTYPLATAAAASQRKEFTPAPPLRPNVQDYVDIDRTLIALRQGS